MMSFNHYLSQIRENTHENKFKKMIIFSMISK